MGLFFFIGMSLVSIIFLIIGFKVIKKYNSLINKPYTSLTGEVVQITSSLRQDGYGVANLYYPVCNFDYKGAEYEVTSKEAYYRPKLLKVGSKVNLRMYEEDPGNIVIDDKHIYAFLKGMGYAFFIVAFVLFIIGLIFYLFFMKI